MTEKRILIVDDSEFDRGLLKNVFTRKTNFQVIEASDGEQCLEIIERGIVDLILMDIMMPGMFGTQILLKIREKFNLVEMPIIMVTSKSDAADIVGCLQNGANDYITKPVNFDMALARISTHLRLADLSKEMSVLDQVNALNAMIATYNHEINSPLTVAIHSLEKIEAKNQEAAEKLRKSLWRISEIVQKIREVSQQKKIEFANYSGSTKMVKIGK